MSNPTPTDKPKQEETGKWREVLGKDKPGGRVEDQLTHRTAPSPKQDVCRCSVCLQNYPFREALSNGDSPELADGIAAQPTPKPAEGELEAMTGVIDTGRRKVAGPLASQSKIAIEDYIQREVKLRIDQIIGWAKSGKSANSYSMDIENVDRMSLDIMGAIARLYDARFEAVMKEAEAAEVDPRKVWYGSKE